MPEPLLPKMELPRTELPVAPWMMVTPVPAFGSAFAPDASPPMVFPATILPDCACCANLA